MQIKNTETKFGVVTRANHWISALLVIGMIGLGIYMHELPDSPSKFELYDLHKAIGIGILMLIIIRLLWLKVSPNPPLLPMKRSEQILAHSVRGLLYLSLLLVPLSGWIMSNAAGHDVSFFNLFTLPQFVPESETLSGIAKGVHALIGKILLPVLILLHIAGAIKHHFIYKDATLKRMLGKD